MFFCDVPDSMSSYLRFREELNLKNKASKHIFVTSNPYIFDTIYTLEEFQNHGHASRSKSSANLV